MAADDAFVAHCLELFEPLGPVSPRRLFGGRGFYLDGVMFALIASDTLYLRVDDQTRGAFAAAGGAPFVYDGAKSRKPVTMPYYTVPLEAMDDPDEMAPWARQAVEAARRAHAAKAPKKPRSTSKAKSRRTSP